MSKTSILAIAAGLFLVTLIGFNVLVADGSEDNPVITSIRDGEESISTKEEAETIEANEATPAPSTDEATEQSETTQPAALGVYANYSESALADAAARDDKVVLSFSADWCPTCQALKRNINAGVIPDGLTILELDYDTEDDFKKKYGVRVQHTLVQVDGQGEQIGIWAGSRDIEDIVAQLN